MIKYFRLFKMSGDMWYPALLAMAEQFRLYFYMDSWGKLIKMIFFLIIFFSSSFDHLEVKCVYTKVRTIKMWHRKTTFKLQSKSFYLNSLKTAYYMKWILVQFTLHNCCVLCSQSPRLKNFGSSRNSLNPTSRPNLQLNSDDSLCQVIDSCMIFGST